ncbi:histidine kinase [Dyadobacter sp. CY327]|uniref:sensor histidine kinase n=1 Tax=Dyadobacter sp. CY327 TaxID=2907301 RepID=UPI001F2E3FB8|nr:sensor histidine kinase [Dyadobacter sp. CY327]MCE7071885.1 histidine kinase [Dyadobacter sp. CY327]
MKKLQCFGTLMMLLTMLSAKAQSQPTDKDFPAQPSDKYSFDHFTTDGAEGLGGGRIKEHNGFIWFSGYTAFNQMARFDGINFKFAELYLGDSLIKASTYYYLFDRKGQLWYGARGNLFLCKKPESWIKKPGQSGRYRMEVDSIYKKVMEPDYVTMIVGEDNQGNLWIAQSSGKLYLFNPVTGKRRIFKFPKGQQVVDWLQDKSGRVWVVSNKELHRLDDLDGSFARVEMRRQVEMPAEAEITKIFEGKNGNIWIGTDRSGIYQFRPTRSRNGIVLSQTEKASLQNCNCKNVTGITEDKSGRIWIGTIGQGVSVYEYGAKKWDHLKSSQINPSGINFNDIFALHSDRQGRVWIGSSFGGVDLFDPVKSHFRTIPQFDSGFKKTSETNYMYFGEGDSLFLFEGTQNHEMIYSLKEKKYKSAFGNNPLRWPTVAQFWVKDRTGKDWLLNASGIYTYDLKNRKVDFYSFPNGREFKTGGLNVVTVIDKKNSGSSAQKRQEIWIGDNLGLSRFDIYTRKWMDNLDLPKTLTRYALERSVHFIRAGNDGAVFIAGIYMPFLRYNIENGNVDVGRYSGDTIQITYDLLEDRSNIWAVTDLGLYQLSKKDLSVMAKYNLGNTDYPDGSILNLTRDGKNHFWLFGAKELVEFSPTTGIVRKFRYQDELQTALLNSVPLYHHKNGTIFFTGSKGITYFNPEELKINKAIPPVKITEIHVMGAPHPLNSEVLRLTYKQNFIDIDFIALNLTNATKNQYQYKMEGIDEQWIKAGSKRVANYTNLPPGDYTFRVIGSNNDGLWNKKGTSLQITIMPPWWGTWWFRSLLIMLFAGGIYGLFRYRLAQQLRQRENEIRASLMAQEAERQRFSRELHDGIGANLSLLKMYLSSFGDADVPMAELKERSERLLAGSVDEIRRLIHDMHPRNLKEMGLVRAVEDMVGLVNLGNGLKVEFDAENVPEHLPEQVEINLFRIVQELLQNAMKLSQASVVWLNFACEKNRFYLTYKDNGVGFDTSGASTGNGLLNIKNRVMLLKGEMLINSSVGDGTKINLNFECACIV